MGEISLPKPKERKLFFSKQVNQESIEKLSKDIILINESDRLLEKIYKVYDLVYIPKPIEIYIDSYGGNVYQAMGLVGIIDKSITPVHTICTGVAMSCGFIILIHGHKRFCYEHGTPLYHQVSGSSDGKVEDIEQYLIEAKRLQNKIEEMTIRKTKITKQQLDENRAKKIDWYVTAKEAKDLKVVDEII